MSWPITDMTAGIVGKQLIIEMPVWFTPKGALGWKSSGIWYQSVSIQSIRCVYVGVWFQLLLGIMTFPGQRSLWTGSKYLLYWELEITKQTVKLKNYSFASRAKRTSLSSCQIVKSPNSALTKEKGTMPTTDPNQELLQPSKNLFNVLSKIKKPKCPSQSKVRHDWYFYKFTSTCRIGTKVNFLHFYWTKNQGQQHFTQWQKNDLCPFQLFQLVLSSRK